MPIGLNYAIDSYYSWICLQRCWIINLIVGQIGIAIARPWYLIYSQNRSCVYPHGSLASHAWGYTQPITESEYDSLVDKGYKISDRISRTGVEEAYEAHLRGQWGGQILEVNAMGEVQRTQRFSTNTFFYQVWVCRL